MSVLDDFRAKYPQYKDVPDLKLAQAIRKKYYADMPPEQFYQRSGLGHLVGLEEKPDAAEGFQTTLQVGPLDTGIKLPQWLSQGLAGAGKSLADTGRGLGQLTGAVSQSEVDESRRLDADLMDTGAGFVGNVGGQVAQMWVPGGMAVKGASFAGRAAPVVGAAASGGAFSATQPVATGETRAGNAAFGAGAGAVGQGIASGFGRVARGLSDNPAVRQTFQQARDLGIRLTPAQLVDSPALQTVSSALNKLPFSGAQKVARTQREDFNRAVARTFGEDAPAVNSDVYSAAKSRIGGTFNKLTERNALKLSPELVDTLGAVEREVAGFGSDDSVRAVRTAIDRLIEQSDNGVVPGRVYQSLDSQLGKLMKGGGEKAAYLGQLRDALRGAMDDSISASDRKAWGTAREQYKNLKTIRDLVSDDGVSPRALMGRVRADGAKKEAMASGRAGQLGELAKLGQKMADKVPDSGTAQRLMAYGALTGGGWASQSENPYLSGLGYSMLAGMLGGRALNSPGIGRYLAEGSAPLQGLAQRLAPVTRALPPAQVATGAAVALGADQPMVLDITGGVPGRALTEEELEALRLQAYGY